MKCPKCGFEFRPYNEFPTKDKIKCGCGEIVTVLVFTKGGNLVGLYCNQCAFRQLRESCYHWVGHLDEEYVFACFNSHPMQRDFKLIYVFDGIGKYDKKYLVEIVKKEIREY